MLLGQISPHRALDSAYDALYIALAETLQVPLLTRDAALGRVPAVLTTIEVVR